MNKKIKTVGCERRIGAVAYSRSRSCMMAAKCSMAHSIMGRQASWKEWARSVRAYSVRGGTVGKTVRVRKPSASRLRRVEVSIFCEMSGMAFWRALKRIGLSWVESSCKTSSDHLSPTRARMLRTGQSGKKESRRDLCVEGCSIVPSKRRASTFIVSPWLKELVLRLNHAIGHGVLLQRSLLGLDADVNQWFCAGAADATAHGRGDAHEAA